MSHPDSDPLYYLDNFQRLLAWVSERYADILSSSERDFITTYYALPTGARALLVRLIMRKGSVFRQSKLIYPEIENLEYEHQEIEESGKSHESETLDHPALIDTAEGGVAKALHILQKAGLVNVSPQVPLSSLFMLFRRDELEQFLPSGKKLSKSDWFLSLKNHHDEFKEWADWYPSSADTLIELLRPTQYDYLSLIFFGNLRQDLSEFILSDLGLFTYETVVMDKASRGFHSRDDVEAYMRLHRLRKMLEYWVRNEQLEGSRKSETPAFRTAQEAYNLRVSFSDDYLSGFERVGTVSDFLANQKVLEILRTPIATEWVDQRRHRTLLYCAEIAAKIGECERSLLFYGMCCAQGARIKRIRLLERLGRFDEAYSLAMTVSSFPDDQEEEQHAERILPRLERKLGLPGKRQKAKETIQSFKLQLDKSASVEQASAMTLDQPDAPVYYVENGLMNSLFGLLFWDAIFAPIQGAFFHPFHTGPADLLRNNFIQKRYALFEEGFSALRSGHYKRVIQHRFHEKYGVQSPFLYWGVLDEQLLHTALECIPAAHLEYWCRWIMADIKRNRAGFADLIQFFPNENRYRMIEVKGPGDRLQDNQRRMIAYAHQHNMPIEVCWVQWCEEIAE